MIYLFFINFFFNSTSRNQPVDVHVFYLAKAINSVHTLAIHTDKNTEVILAMSC